MGDPVGLHFELDPSDPDQERAWAVLEEWQSLGLSIQQIITLALLELADAQPLKDNEVSLDSASMEEIRRSIAEVHLTTRASLAEIKHTLDAMQKALKNLERNPITSPPNIGQDSAAPALAVSPELLNSLKKSLHKGIRLEDSS